MTSRMGSIALAGAFAAGLIGITSANLSTASDTTNPGGAFGALTLTAATATAIPTTCLLNRAGVAVQNLDTVAIYCGTTSSVATTTGTKVFPDQLVAFEVSCNSSRTAFIWCISAAGTAANGVRYMELR